MTQLGSTSPRVPTTVEIKLGDSQHAANQSVNPALGNAAANTVRVATSVELYTYDPAPNCFMIQRKLTSGHTMEEQVSEETRAKAHQVFSRLQGLIAIHLGERGGLDKSLVAMVRVEVDVVNQRAKWWVKGSTEVHEIFLGYREELFNGEEIYNCMNALAMGIGAETHRGDKPLARLTKGVHGHKLNKHALNYRPKDGGFTIPVVGVEVTKKSDKLPQTFDSYAEKHLAKAMEGKNRQEVIGVMKEMSRAELVREDAMKFLQDQITGRENRVKDMKKDNPASSSVHVERETRTIQQLKWRLHMLSEANMFAVQAFLAHRGTGTTIVDAEMLAKAVGKEMLTVGGIHKERSMLNPKNIRGLEEELPQDAQEYANRIGSLVITDPLAYQRYCELHKLNPNEHAAIEQGCLINGNYDVLLDDIQDSELKKSLKDDLKKTGKKVEALHAEIDKIAATDTAAVIAEARKLHQGVLNPAPVAPTPQPAPNPAAPVPPPAPAAAPVP